MKGRRIAPTRVYLLLTGSYSLFFTIFATVNLVYQTQTAGLNPFQLVLVGTALESTVFLCEVPTGIVADAVSRRLSVIIGLFLIGLGLILTGLWAQFETLLLAQVVWGVGFTFTSGAQQAWIADEIGAENAGPVYLRSTQFEQFGRLVGIPLGVALGTVRLNLPILVGGALFLGLGALLALIMPEHGFKPAPRESRSSWRAMGDIFISGTRLVRRRPLLLTIFGIAAFNGMASEGFDRLWIAHFLRDVGFPDFHDLDPVIWFGAIRMGSTILGIIGLEVLRRRFDTTSHTAVTRGLFIINALQVGSVIVFGLAGGLALGVAAFWSTTVLSRMYDPLYLAWINQNIESRVRATVLSMTSQMDALGQISGGPVLGAIGSLVSIPAALVSAGVALSPALLLYARAFGQGGSPTAPGAGEAEP